MVAARRNKLSGSLSSSTGSKGRRETKSPTSVKRSLTAFTASGNSTACLLGDVASGQHVLQITPTTGSKLVVRLTGASAAISAFNACFKAEGSSTPSSQDSGNAAISPSSQQRKSCLLELKGKKFIDGKCAYWSDGDSGFQIDAGGYFAQVMLDDPTHATATWNETKDSTHAQTELGRLTKQGDCWANTEAKICAK
jgi:hypothetical protein